MFVSDDRYTRNLGIASYSVLHNMCPAVEQVRIFVMDCGISESNKALLVKQVSRFDNAKIYFHNIERQLDEIATRVATDWHKAIYGRLFFPELLEQYENLERLIYLDCDLLMDGPVTELFTMDMQGKCVAGVADGYDTARKRDLGIDPDCTYINSGVLVIDTAHWTALNASERIVELINSYPRQLIYPDQDAINYVLAQDILVLHPRYNMLWMLCDRDIPKMLHHLESFHYTSEELYDGLHHGKIYHYAGRDMWSFYSITPTHAEIFVKYRRLSDWRHEKRRFGSVRNFVLWTLIRAKHLVTGD